MSLIETADGDFPDEITCMAVCQEAGHAWYLNRGVILGNGIASSLQTPLVPCCHCPLYLSLPDVMHRAVRSALAAYYSSIPKVAESLWVKGAHRVLGSLNDVKHDQLSHKARGPQHHDLVGFLHDGERRATTPRY